jgi:hypothetical protein
VINFGKKPVRIRITFLEIQNMRPKNVTKSTFIKGKKTIVEGEVGKG